MERVLRATIDTYFLNTIGLWKRCNKPKRKPDYVSFKRSFVCGDRDANPLEVLEWRGVEVKYFKHSFIDYRDDLRVYYEDRKKGISSRYWYGENSKGKYIIRESDHWGSVASCEWGITKSNRKETYLIYGKIYLGNGRKN